MTPEKLRAIYGEPVEIAKYKVISSFDQHCRDFIENAPFMVLATSDGTNLEVSPKGDAPGFVTIESDTTLLLPDRPGNNRVDGLMNILNCPQVALMFLIPGVDETLRVNGLAEILDDADICQRFAINNRAPKTVLRITAQRIFLHCGRAINKAAIWKSDTWPEERPIARLNPILTAHRDLM